MTGWKVHSNSKTRRGNGSWADKVPPKVPKKAKPETTEPGEVLAPEPTRPPFERLNKAAIGRRPLDKARLEINAQRQWEMQCILDDIAWNGETEQIRTVAAAKLLEFLKNEKAEEGAQVVFDLSRLSFAQLATLRRAIETGAIQPPEGINIKGTDNERSMG